MAFDGITTYAVAKELRDQLLQGKIDRIFQPGKFELVFHIHTRRGNFRLYGSCASESASVRLIRENLPNPPEPPAFCMFLRKHLTGARIADIRQKDSERILEMTFESLNELGFTVTKKLIFEIMGRHSNIILVNLETGKILDSVKHISVDESRARQILPGLPYEYPPAQDKIPLGEATEEDLQNAGESGRSVLSRIGGISPAFARAVAASPDRAAFLSETLRSIDDGTNTPTVYLDADGDPKEFSPVKLPEYEGSVEALRFEDMSAAQDYYFEHRARSSRTAQQARELLRNVSARLEKLYLKKQRLEEDLLHAENSEPLRLYGELLTANAHAIRSGMSEATVTNYYDGSEVTIPLDPRFSPAKNAQQYFHRYAKARTAIHEKKTQIESNDEFIGYLESVQTSLENADDPDVVEAIRQELTEAGLVRPRKADRKRKPKRFKAQPLIYFTSDHFRVLVGRNNKENDQLTLRHADRRDYWLHTKNIPGSHVIVELNGRSITETAIREAAACAAYHSKSRNSENVPVDYVPLRYVKKPAGAKPGMVIFTNNRTVYVDPALPGGKA